jgi:hypothetical protein
MKGYIKSYPRMKKTRRGFKSFDPDQLETDVKRNG